MIAPQRAQKRTRGRILTASSVAGRETKKMIPKGAKNVMDQYWNMIVHVAWMMIIMAGVQIHPVKTM